MQPVFTEQELEDLANMAVGRHDALASILVSNPDVPNKKQLKATIADLAPLAEKLRPFYTGKDS